VLVHASGKPDRGCDLAELEEPDLLGPSGLQLGGVVGITEIVDCVTTHRSKWFTNAGYAFVLRNSRPLPFVPWKGQLGIRDVPASLLRKLNL
jgi:hypothetical protein